ncbi:hypothetical protein QYE76_037922 [Lolium multiflorum]|uniref:Uncharacterized protein n=1 Tax=Lolium multiflorum TaxID=4521 RepID=A0AAD8WQM4_LOLMU|nr:hypothetical protein QYE76_037918 [Lolium multiflorum]KAK1677074.1 hypothetical protein QYE76_037922 [Lolium multiflorum]
MVKKKGSTGAASATLSNAAAKITSDTSKKNTPEVSATAPAPVDWPASTMTKRDEKKSRSLGLISPDEGNIILLAPEKANTQPPKRPSGGFADEDDLLDFDEGFIEPPSKKAKASPSRPTPAASEASARAAVTTAQPSTASSLSKGKEIPLTAAAIASPEKPGFASQFSSLETDKIRLQGEVESTSSKLDNAVKMAAAAFQNADSLKKELDQLKKKLKEEEKERVESENQRKEREGLLRQSILALLEAADIPASPGGKLPDNSSADALTMAIESGDLIRALLKKNKGVISRLHAMIFPKANQEKSLEQLRDAFAIDVEGTIEVFKHTSRTYGALLSFQLMMGHGFKANMELMTKELPKDQDGQAIDLSLFKVSVRKCPLQLLELVLANKSTDGKAGPSLSTQTQAP